MLYGRLAKRKLKRFKEYASLYPECCWIFIGDNGQVGTSRLHQTAPCYHCCMQRQLIYGRGPGDLSSMLEQVLQSIVQICTASYRPATVCMIVCSARLSPCKLLM